MQARVIFLGPAVEYFRQILLLKLKQGRRRPYPFLEEPFTLYRTRWNVANRTFMQLTVSKIAPASRYIIPFVIGPRLTNIRGFHRARWGCYCGILPAGSQRGFYFN